MKKNLDAYLLTKQELQIMKVLWRRGSATVREVCDALSQRKTLAYTTVLTLMQIMGKKGLLIRKRIGRAHHYQPVFSQHQATRNQVDDVLDRYFEGNANRFIEAVMENEFVPD